jgi:hypothetical protein
MNDAEIEFYISRILSGFLIFFYNNERYELQYPNCYLRYESNLIYNNIINDEKYGEWIREENLIRVLIMLGLWTQETEKTIGQIEKQIDNLKVDLYNNILNKTMQTKIRSNLRTKEEQLNRILNIKQEFLGNTLEGYAASIKNEYIVCNTLYKNKRLVFNIDDVKSSSSYQYFNNLINEVNHHMIPIKVYKAIARSHTWRSYWNCNKNNIFDKQVIDWTDEQRSLINITKMYDNIYEHPECPDDKIIEDDDVLDGWLIVQKRKIAKAKVQQTIDSSNPKLKNAQEVFVMASDQDSREEVFGLNSGEALHRMKEKFAYINSMNNSDSVEDLSLPDVRREAISKTRTAPQN